MRNRNPNITDDAYKQKESKYLDDYFFNSRKKNPRRRKEIEQAEGIEILKTQGVLEIEIQQKARMNLASQVVNKLYTNILFFLFCVIILTLFYFVSIFAFALLLFVFLSYILYNQVINKHKKIVVSIESESLKITESVFDYTISNVEMRLDQPKQFFVRKYDLEYEIQPLSYSYYNLLVMLKNNKRKAIFVDKLKRQSALFLEQEIERYLIIRDKKMPNDIIDEQE